MIRGTVTFRFGDPYVAILRDEGWSCAGLEPLVGILNSRCGLDRYGPADGDPLASAVRDAAELLSGTPEILTPSPSGPSERVY